MKISIIGVGAYSIALAKSLAKNMDNKIIMWTESKMKYEEFKKTKQLDSVVKCNIPKNVTLSLDMSVVLKDSDLIYIATASRFVDAVAKNMKPFYKKNIPICIASKGIEESTEELLSNVVMQTLNTKNISVISGPTFAIDIINNEPVALAIGSKNLSNRNTVMRSLVNDTMKLRPTKDMIGIQLCGAIKNVIAIAAGILKGLGYSESTQAFLINESLHDIKEIIYYFGGKPKTILSFAGVGDLMLTCTSTKSRNFSFGFVIGSTQNENKIRDYLNKNTVEGYHTLDTIHSMLKKKNVKIELIDIIYNIVYNMEDPNILAKFLITKK